MSGAVQKGPFQVGSAVTLDIYSADGKSVLSTVSTQTDNDLGQFNVSISESTKLLGLSATGYYQNEISAPGAFFKRSILVSRPVQKDEVFTEENLRIARPGDGLCPSLWSEVLGSRASANFEVGHPLTVQDFKKV